MQSEQSFFLSFLDRDFCSMSGDDGPIRAIATCSLAFGPPDDMQHQDRFGRSFMLLLNPSSAQKQVCLLVPSLAIRRGQFRIFPTGVRQAPVSRISCFPSPASTSIEVPFSCTRISWWQLGLNMDPWCLGPSDKIHKALLSTFKKDPKFMNPTV